MLTPKWTRHMARAAVFIVSAPAFAQSGPPMPTPTPAPSSMPAPSAMKGTFPAPGAPTGPGMLPTPSSTPAPGTVPTPRPALKGVGKPAAFKLVCEYRRAGDDVSYYMKNAGVGIAPAGTSFDYWFQTLDKANATRTAAQYTLTTALPPGAVQKLQSGLKASQAGECGPER